ncbi:PREDICTED: endoplasmin-like [Amphimedon queenslandica]|uniref:Histidine kinase/HSP90-like ATPase domain-containing protein n=1 Tax=Amphimedon queenslandica TaxID=400682 RepID=A0A1X7VS10_AMPQE|nr:PREDICTED: endoplasmin-like [Amphimedon queenslandica]|eukprot:XP_019855235.1 PREDICTED: endoplasmin-like [Amphimedon queenslandica]
MKKIYFILVLLSLTCFTGIVHCQEEEEEYAGTDTPPTVDPDIGASRDALKTDDETIQKEEEAIKLDGLSVAEMKELRDKAEKFTFQAEVNRMMKLIINSLYRNKEIFLRELISNASDALDKIRFISLTDKSALSAVEELTIKIRADKENNALHITDTGIGMTRQDLETNLGTIAKSGTTEFLEKITAAESASAANDLIGQFGVGFYSSFLVADRVVVTSKHNDDKQYIWESDSASFSIVEDPRGDTLKRGTTVSLFFKEEAQEFLGDEKLKGLVQKYSQFINFPIYLWTSRTESVEEPVDDDTEDKSDDDDEATVEDEGDKPKTKKVDKTVWDWDIVNDSKPIWLRSPKDIENEEYEAFYKAFTKNSEAPLAKIHFTAEGEVTFRAILFVPATPSNDLFTKYAKASDKIKVYVRRVFITDNFEDLMPRYLGFVFGVVDSDDLPLNVSRETLQQHKLLKIIKKKLVRKALDMLKKMDEETYEKFWSNYSTHIKLGVVEDFSNKSRVAKLLRFTSSNDPDKLTSLDEYIERMKDKQEHIYYMAGETKKQVEGSPFVERLLKKGYEVLYMTDAVDEYCMEALTEYEGKKFHNAAKEGLTFADEGESHKEQFEKLVEEYKPLTTWLKETALSDSIEKAVVSNRLTTSPCALVANQHAWSGNMERVMRAQAYAQSKDANTEFYLNQKKTFEINPRHPLIQELQRKVQEDSTSEASMDLARILLDTAKLRGGYFVDDSKEFASRIERMLRVSIGVPPDAAIEEEVFEPLDERGDGADEEEAEEVTDEEETPTETPDKDEL